jgi:hypothetical protein
MDFGIAETGIARSSPPGTTTEVLRFGIPFAEIRVVSVPEYNSDSGTAPGHASDSSPLSEFYSNSDYEFDFGSDPEEPESEDNSTELPLSGPASGPVITSTPAGRFVYWPDRNPADLISGDSRYVAYIDSLPFQEGTRLARADSNTPTEVAVSESSLGTPDRQVFIAAGDTPRPSGMAQDKYLEDISSDELSADAPADETTANRYARRERNRKRSERRRRLCRMDFPGPTTSVGTRTDYSVGPWDYPACATWHLMAWSTRTTKE